MTRSLLWLGASFASSLVFAQATDGIDRNLLERQQREIRFGVSLYEEPPLPRAPAGEPSMPITLLPPGLNPLGDRGRPVQQRPAPAPGPAVSTTTQDLERLHASQQQRQQQQQLQTRDLPEPQRRQESNTQQLIFERENRAQELGAEIMRRSGAATGTR
jgi:hypothetical protein